jgi:L-2-hydroxyglutarate oxidase
LHQTGRNSGVIHSGIYYKPNSNKALLCREGRKLLHDFLRENKIPFDQCGKLIVARNISEKNTLKKLLKKGEENKVDCSIVDANGIREIEPSCCASDGIFVKDAGIVDYGRVLDTLETILKSKDVEFVFNTKSYKFQNLNNQIRIDCSKGIYDTNYLINCAGLYSDYIEGNGSPGKDVRIVPFRGEYYKLKHNYRHYVKNMIYPVPDERFPFLGIHLTRRIGGDVDCGPNAVLAFAREGYKWTNINANELLNTVAYKGFINLALKYWKFGMHEFARSLSKYLFIKEVQTLVPSINSGMVEKVQSGVRAQAVSKNGDLVDDFVFKRSGNFLSVINSPSPAATSCFAIGNKIVNELYNPKDMGKVESLKQRKM